jgi:hypothetical protein
MSHHTATETKITHAHVQAWLDAYARAWETYDPEDIAPLFTDDAEYRWHPADDPEVGRATIVDAWVNPGGNASSRDEPGTYQAEIRPFVVEGNKAVAIGTCTYWSDASRQKVERVYYNNWLLEFGPDGKCRSFTEYWMTPRGAKY